MNSIGRNPATKSAEEMAGEIERLKAELSAVKMALIGAILHDRYTRLRIVDLDPGGCTYKVSWTEEAFLLAGLCDLDLRRHDPALYRRTR